MNRMIYRYYRAGCFFYANVFFSYAHSGVGVLLGYGFLFFMLLVLFFMLMVFSVMLAVLSFMLLVSFFMLMVSFFMLRVLFLCGTVGSGHVGGPSAECNCQEGLVQNVIVGRL